MEGGPLQLSTAFELKTSNAIDSSKPHSNRADLMCKREVCANVVPLW